MQIRTVPAYQEMSAIAAGMIAAILRANPAAVLGLATGSTPIGTYDELARLCREEGLDFSRASSVNLDEYLGLDGTHPQSYRYFMDEHLFDRVNIDKARTAVPSGVAADPDAECARYDALVKSLGGQDVQLLGIGPDGHIGFNEPADEFVGPTHLVDLDPSTIEANARFFASEAEVPRRAITMGMDAIMGAKSIILIAAGEGKRAVLEAAVQGPVTPRLPASILQNHPDVTVLFAEQNG
ncbi:MAG: glucosamine-6-phosphate deaminase [Kiritimatiellae bacterium]|nr:glucosamine-6-phosphate deaminase [Kiritimatiellia bacterium]